MQTEDPSKVTAGRRKQHFISCKHTRFQSSTQTFERCYIYVCMWTIHQMFPLLRIQQSSAVGPSLCLALSLISFRPNAFQIFAQLTVWSIFIFTPSPSTFVSLLSKQIFIATWVIKAMAAQWMLMITGRWGKERLRDERNQVDSEQRAAEAKHKNNAGTGSALSKLLVCSYTVSHKHLWKSNGLKCLMLQCRL